MKVFFMLTIAVVFASCVRNKSGQTVQTTMPENTNVFEVSEVIQGNTYTYMRVKENMSEKWVATAKTTASEGDVLYYDEALQMKDFPSKELDRTFDEIYFVNRVSEKPIQQKPAGQNPMGQMPSSHSGKKQIEKESSISIEKAENEITVGQLFANRDEYAGKEIKIRGVVAKVNKNIMGKNWVHIQDGTSSDGKFDLTVTTQDMVELNDKVTFHGTIILEKDFGAGYYYDVIMEDAKVLKNSKNLKKY